MIVSLIILHLLINNNNNIALCLTMPLSCYKFTVNHGFLGLFALMMMMGMHVVGVVVLIIIIIIYYY